MAGMEPQRATARDIRRHNRPVVLSKLFFDGPLSRYELSQLTGLSGATVSNVTAELAEEGVVVEAGLVDSDGGRPRVLPRVNPSYAYVIGIDVGDACAKVELFDLSMARQAGADRPLSELQVPKTSSAQARQHVRTRGRTPPRRSRRWISRRVIVRSPFLVT
jgi:hypothetical protein